MVGSQHGHQEACLGQSYRAHVGSPMPPPEPRHLNPGQEQKKATAWPWLCRTQSPVYQWLSSWCWSKGFLEGVGEEGESQIPPHKALDTCFCFIQQLCVRVYRKKGSTKNRSLSYKHSGAPRLCPGHAPCLHGPFHTCGVKHLIGPGFGAGNLISSGRNNEQIVHSTAWAALAEVKDDLSTSV